MTDKKLKSIIKRAANKAFSQNQENFRSEAMDECDLEQEGYFITIEILKNPRYGSLTEEELEKLIWTSLKHCFQRISKKSQGRRGVAKKILNPTKGTENEIFDEEHLSNISVKNHAPDLNGLLSDDLRQICTEEELDILRQLYAEGKTLKEIGEKCGLSESRISQKLKDIMIKLRSKEFSFMANQNRIRQFRIVIILKIFKKN